MKTDLTEITVVLKPDLDSVGLSQVEFDQAYDAFSRIVNESKVTVTGYCNQTFGRPTHIVTKVECIGRNVFQARIAFLESHPETGSAAKNLLTASLAGRVKWLFAITKSPLEIRSIEAITEEL